jgi:hypothetical protein
MCVDIVALDRKWCRMVTALLTGHCTLRRNLNIMGLSETHEHQNCRSHYGVHFSNLLYWYRIFGKIVMKPIIDFPS